MARGMGLGNMRTFCSLALGTFLCEIFGGHVKQPISAQSVVDNQSQFENRTRAAECRINPAWSPRSIFFGVVQC